MSNKQLPYQLEWGMSPEALINALTKANFEYDKDFSAFYGVFNWPNCPTVLKGCDVVVSNEEQTNENLDFFTMMIFPSDDCYNEDEADVYSQIEADQQAIFTYFKQLYGSYSDEGEKVDENNDDLVTRYKAWAFDNLFITLAMDKLTPDEGLDQPAFVVSLTFSPDEE